VRAANCVQNVSIVGHIRGRAYATPFTELHSGERGGSAFRQAVAGEGCWTEALSPGERRSPMFRCRRTVARGRTVEVPD
jgi:hypothetical protein